MTLKIIDFPWHQAHGYRLHALPAEFWYLKIYRHVGNKVCWDDRQRGRPSNFRGAITDAEARAMPFDAILAHLDQWCDLDLMRALPFRRMDALAHERNLPHVCIMHGTPDDAGNRFRILQLMGQWPVVCNSHQAAREWDGGEGRRDCYGLPQFRTIIHGYDVDEFLNFTLDRRVTDSIVTVCSGGEVSRDYHGLPLLERLFRDVPMTWYGPSGNADWFKTYDEYRDMLAGALVYFSPTRRAPMPGARTEAMLSGACIVTVPGNDAQRVIEHGKTGFIVNTYAEALDTCRALLADPERAYAVGQAGREAARKMFDKGRYVTDWLKLLAEIGVKLDALAY